MEKMNNSQRYIGFNITMDKVNEIFERHGYDFSRMDRYVVDGWTPELPVNIDLGGGNFEIKLAGYGDGIVTMGNVMERSSFSLEGPVPLHYSSYLHVAGHIASAYCSSPMAKAGEDSYVLVWDGGMAPQLFYYHCGTNKIENIGILFPIVGNVYAVFSQHFDPFTVHFDKPVDELNVAGKVMAYIAKGSYRQEILNDLNLLYEQYKDKGSNFAYILGQELLIKNSYCKYAHEDILYTFHMWLERLLVEKLAERIASGGSRAKNLCFAGGSALNIKWNSAIRNSGLFKVVWVAPFPNDSGNAIGAACCEMIHSTGCNALHWDVYSGPEIEEGILEEGWRKRPMSIEALAAYLFNENLPVVFLNGRAELGPRALGNRSILAPATDASMKKLLNDVKNREYYRPVAPICLEDDAVGIFDPGSKDPYMLFDHLVRPEWKERIPAICHLDGTARLQTVNERENREIFGLLTEYKKLSGIPLLCNTSANFNGKGFFPDVASAMRWDRIGKIWCNGNLYEKEEGVKTEAGASQKMRKTNTLI